MISFVIDELVDNDSVNKLGSAAEAADHNVFYMKYTPFLDQEHEWPFDPEYEKGPVVFLGSINLAHMVNRYTRWLPGCFAQFDYYKWSYYSNYISKFLWNFESVMYPYGYFRSRYESIRVDIDHHSAESVFVRPDTGCKSFTGQIVRTEDDLRYLDTRAKPSDLVVVSQVAVPATEWRFFCSKQGVITGSQYRRQGRLEVDELGDVPAGAADFCLKVIGSLQDFPEELFVVDVGVDSDGNFGVIEMNSFSCSGIYACDADKIISAAASVAERLWKEMYQQ